MRTFFWQCRDSRLLKKPGCVAPSWAFPCTAVVKCFLMKSGKFRQVRRRRIVPNVYSNFEQMPWESGRQGIGKIIQNSWHLASVAKMDGAVAEEVRRGPLIAKTSFDSRTTRVGFVVDQVEVKIFLQIHQFCLSVLFSTCSIIIIHSSITEAIHFFSTDIGFNQNTPLPLPPFLFLSLTPQRL